MSKRSMVALAMGCLLAVGLSPARAASEFNGVLRTGSRQGQCTGSCGLWVSGVPSIGSCEPSSPLADNANNPIMQVHDIGSLASASARTGYFSVTDVGGGGGILEINVLPVDDQCTYQPGDQRLMQLTVGAPPKSFPIPRHTAWLVVWSKNDPGGFIDLQYRIAI